jgi:hypothetical protein
MLSGGALLGHLIEARKDPVAMLHRVCAEAGDLLRFRAPGRSPRPPQCESQRAPFT